ncbi:dihydroneopterin aldolase [Psychromicrobium xiongbiense]|uniref:dihydroneopterin aldolase n=1 Tax=Psychromicrobium xiongbiense TaxID=3051184 RepID=UPI0025574C0A|nr:dihydroneopterin aldolase [Psychromicrobium sp. YIM S02556]
MTQHTDPLDRISLNGIGGTGYHGVFDHERREGQVFIVDVVLYTDFRAAAATDDLEKTVHYGLAANLVHGFIVGEPFKLIETLAERIAAGLLAGFPLAKVEVTVHKPQAPIEVPFGDVTVSITRSAQPEGQP